MFVVLSTGKIINLAHVASIEPFEQGQRAIRMRLSTGQHDVASGCSQEDYDRVVATASGESCPEPPKKQKRVGRPSNALKEAREICDSMGISWETDDTVEGLAERIEAEKAQNA